MSNILAFSCAPHFLGSPPPKNFRIQLPHHHASWLTSWHLLIHFWLPLLWSPLNLSCPQFPSLVLTWHHPLDLCFPPTLSQDIVLESGFTYTHVKEKQKYRLGEKDQSESFSFTVQSSVVSGGYGQKKACETFCFRAFLLTTPRSIHCPVSW